MIVIILLLDLPLLTEIILNNDALNGHCSNKGISIEPYNYVNTLQLRSNMYYSSFIF